MLRCVAARFSGCHAFCNGRQGISVSTTSTMFRHGFPNYRLEACHGAHPCFAVASVLTLADGLRASRHALWDEVRGRMVTFADAIRSNA